MAKKTRARASPSSVEDATNPVVDPKTVDEVLATPKSQAYFNSQRGFSVKIDFSGVEDFKPLPAGTYDALLESYTFDKAKSSGEPKVNVVFEVTEEEFSKRKLWRDYSLQPQALFGIKQACIALGADPAEFDGQVDLEEVLTNLRGNPCRVVVVNEEYEGKERNKVKSVLEAGAGALFSR